MRRRALLATLPAAVTAGCTIGGEPPEPDSLALSIPAVADGEIPPRYTCDGSGISPELRVEGVPDRVESLAVVGEWLYSFTPGTFWLLWNLPPEDGLTVPADRPAEPRLDDPEGAFQGTNDEGFVGYRPPCHRTPDHDRYQFELLALEAAPELEAGAGRDAFDDAVEGGIVSRASLTATYDRV